MTKLSGARQAVVAVVSALVLGGVGALLWSQLATPGEWSVVDRGLSMGQEQSLGEFKVVGMFVLVGIVLSVLWSAVLTAASRPGALTIACVVVGSVVMALIAWQVGMRLGPPDPRTVTGLAVGDTVPDQLAVGAVSPFMAWPIAALVGLLVGSFVPGPDDDEQDRIDRGPIDQNWAMGASTAPVDDARS